MARPYLLLPLQPAAPQLQAEAALAACASHSGADAALYVNVAMQLHRKLPLAQASTQRLV